jgi:hypothetical protein
MRTRSVFVCLAAVLFASCAPKRSEISLNTNETPASVLLQRVEERSQRITSLVGNGIISFDSPEISGSAAFQSNMKKPDSLLVTLTGPFGIDVGTFFLSKEKYVMYNSLENSVTTGDPKNSAIRSIIPFDLTSEQILNAFAGVFVIRDLESNLQRYVVEDDAFVLSYASGTNTSTYWVDPQSLLVSRFEQRNTEGELLVEAKAAAFMNEENLSAARRIQIQFPKQSRQISISYRSLKLNVSDTDFSFTVPSSAKQIVR